ncbi:hypothetical protein EDF62_1024 [Leucobacter luti]|uniref:DoxX-like protein n=1 Tax=Leucobacter luti TaxID=340320 RepID=A0A4R6S5N0_9MICO|nr:hypothetical protein [Leucobacter luti]TDP94604.1 hypothetical protein EDF62_1024 [Leucobacter luti]
MPAILCSAVLAALAVFQIALACGAPLGAYAWGGQHGGVLPVRLRIGSAVSVVLYAILAGIMLSRAGIVTLLPDAVARPAAWTVFGYFVLGAIMNLISRSPKERAVMTPLSVVLAVLALLVAR